jgi:hypothetical protein
LSTVTDLLHRSLGHASGVNLAKLLVNVVVLILLEPGVAELPLHAGGRPAGQGPKRAHHQDRRPEQQQ